MVPEEEARWSQVIHGLRQGEPEVARQFCAQYGAALHRLAEKHLPRPMQRRVGAEDIVQSVCRTFFRRAGDGEFQLDDSAGLWRLLCAITLTKVREQTRFHLRKKRGLDQEAAPLPTSADSGFSFSPADPDPTPAELAEFTDQFQKLIAGLDEEERQVVDLKLQDCTNDEVAERMGCSERTVRRILKRAQAQLSRTFGADAPE